MFGRVSVIVRKRLDLSRQQGDIARGGGAQHCLISTLCARAIDRVMMMGSSFNNRTRGSEDNREAKGSHSFCCTVADTICQYTSSEKQQLHEYKAE